MSKTSPTPPAHSPRVVEPTNNVASASSGFGSLSPKQTISRPPTVHPIPYHSPPQTWAITGASSSSTRPLSAQPLASPSIPAPNHAPQPTHPSTPAPTHSSQHPQAPLSPQAEEEGFKLFSERFQLPEDLFGYPSKELLLRVLWSAFVDPATRAQCAELARRVPASQRTLERNSRQLSGGQEIALISFWKHTKEFLKEGKVEEAVRVWHHLGQAQGKLGRYAMSAGANVAGQAGPSNFQYGIPGHMGVPMVPQPTVHSNGLMQPQMPMPRAYNPALVQHRPPLGRSSTDPALLRMHTPSAQQFMQYPQMHPGTPLPFMNAAMAHMNGFRPPSAMPQQPPPPPSRAQSRAASTSTAKRGKKRAREPENAESAPQGSSEKPPARKRARGKAAAATPLPQPATTPVPMQPAPQAYGQAQYPPMPMPMHPQLLAQQQQYMMLQSGYPMPSRDFPWQYAQAQMPSQATSSTPTPVHTPSVLTPPIPGYRTQMEQWYASGMPLTQPQRPMSSHMPGTYAHMYTPIQGIPGHISSMPAMQPSVAQLPYHPLNPALRSHAATPAQPQAGSSKDTVEVLEPKAKKQTRTKRAVDPPEAAADGVKVPKGKGKKRAVDVAEDQEAPPADEHAKLDPMLRAAVAEEELPGEDVYLVPKSEMYALCEWLLADRRSRCPDCHKGKCREPGHLDEFIAQRGPRETADFGILQPEHLKEELWIRAPQFKGPFTGYMDLIKALSPKDILHLENDFFFLHEFSRFATYTLTLSIPLADTDASPSPS